MAPKQSFPIIFLIAYTSHFIRMSHTCLPISILRNKNVLCNKENTKLINKILKKIIFEKNFLLQTLKEKISSNGSYLTPLVILNEKIYFFKTWKAEKKIFHFISTPQYHKKEKLIEISKKITSLLHENKDEFQKIAILFSIINQITFIIGDPGTGKTTIVSKILTGIKIIFPKKKLKIQLAATTGKAAYRLTESVNNSISNLKNFYKNETISIKPAVTLHRLLKVNFKSYQYFKHSEKFLDIDILIVDESSMIDIFIMEKLIDSISKKTKIIFLGDPNQLPPIGCGHVLKDIYSYHYNGYTKKMTQNISIFKINSIKQISNYKFSEINEKICVLKKNYRFNEKSDIYYISNKIKKNKFNNFKKLFSNTYKNIKFFTLNTGQDYKRMIKNLTKNYINYWNILNKQKISDIISIFNNHKLICIFKNGPFGIQGLNEELEYEMNKQGLIKKIVIDEKIIYFGQPILILKNDYTMNLYNGDTGIIMYGKNNTLQAFFEINKNKTKAIPINLLPKFQTNWAMSVHKSQGSEFNHVSLVLPHTQLNILNKDIIYTAITRAKKTLTIYSSKKTFKKAIKNKTVRYGGLSQNECIYAK
ncbi:MAG: exodeoxyribonuclease V subunit alpha [Buchnera aphidicola (Nurudea shiraii)]